MTIEHSQLSGAALHNSKVLTFTGDPAAYVPPEAGILVCCLTAPNVGKLYRTTGTTAGAVALLATGQDGAAATVSIGDVTITAPADPVTVANSGTAQAAVLDFTFPANLAVAETFTGNPAAYTPTETGVLVVRGDVTPNQLYRTTGTSAGAVIAVGIGELDPDLAAYAALTTTGLVERTGAGTVATVPVSSFAKTLLDDANQGEARNTLGLVIGTNVQAWSTRLDNFSALITTSGTIEKTGASTYGTYTVSAFAKTLLDDADATTARGTLGLGTIATQAANNVAITGGTITGIADLAIADGGTGASTPAAARTNLGATTLGGNLFTIANPGAITFPRFNADNSVSPLSGGDFRAAIAAAAADHTHPYDAAISLTPQNSFTAFSGSYENSLTIYPALKLAVLRFALSRTTIPANQTVALTWSSTYATNRGIIGFSPAVNFGDNMTVAPLVLGYVDGNELKFNYVRNSGGTTITYLLGTVSFTYA